MDDLFGDDEAAPPAKEESRADKMAAAKAAKDAKKKIDRRGAGGVHAYLYSSPFVAQSGGLDEHQ